MKAGVVKSPTRRKSGVRPRGEPERRIGGQRPRCVLVEAKAPVAKEYFAAVTYDALAKLPVMIFSDMGGIDIEQVAEEHPDHVAKMHFSTLIPFSDFKAKELVASLGIKGGDLTQLTGVDLTKVTESFLGVGTRSAPATGGLGTIIVDGIVLTAE
jgi:succinyl-CoA synthetase beta subunit